MASIAAAELRRLKTAHILTKMLIKSFRNSGFTKETFIAPLNGTLSYYIPAGYVHDFCAITENLHMRKKSQRYLRRKYPELFNVAYDLRGQRDILTHRYGLSEGKINWSSVWETFDCRLESDLMPLLKKAIVGYYQDKKRDSKSI